MPTFFFHLRAPAGLERDEIGLDCASFESAYLEAYGAIPQLAADLIRRGRDPMEYAFEIESEAGLLLIELPFREMVRTRTARPRPFPVERMRATAGIERVHALAASIDEEVATLHREMQASREWLASTRAGMAASAGGRP